MVPCLNLSAYTFSFFNVMRDQLTNTVLVVDSLVTLTAFDIHSRVI